MSTQAKKARWSQLGQAVPPALAEAVALSVKAQDVTAPPKSKIRSVKPR